MILEEGAPCVFIWLHIALLVIIREKGSQHSMGVSKNRGIPKWMVYNGKPY